MLNRSTLIALSLISGFASQAIQASSCGSDETLSLMQRQAQAYAAGQNYMEFAPIVLGNPEDLCAEDEEQTIQRHTQRVAELDAQAQAYADNYQFDAYRLATLQGRLADHSVALAE